MSPLTFRLGPAATTLASLLLTGCGSLTGLDGTSSYACKAPEGVKCDSVSGTYYNAIQNNLPSQRRSPTSAPATSPASPIPATRAAPVLLSTGARAPADDAAGYAATPLRASPKVLRLWIKSWEDADRDLNGESLVYVQVDNGRWLVDHVQRQSREAFAPVRPGKSPAATKSSGDPSKPTSSAAPDDATSITQALRALQGRVPTPSDN
jgi:conjugal transfer pilus assembly protein TraV